MSEISPSDINKDESANRFIAIFDVLGFRNLMNNEGPTALALKLADIIERSKNIKDIFLLDHISVRVFQDTICLYTDTNSQKNLQALLGYSAMFCAVAFNSFIHLRGAITEGEVYADNNLILGSGFIEAYEMHEAQDWIGTWVSQEMLERWTPETGDYSIIVPYEIPMKTGKVEVRPALNTFQFAYMSRQVSEYMFSQMRKNALTWDAKRKLDNTESFFHYLNEKGYYKHLESDETPAPTDNL